jgi:cytochrome c
MSGKTLWMNMIAGTVLATGLGIMGLQWIGDAVYSTDHEAVGFPVEVAEAGEGAGGAAAAGPELMPDWGTLLADPTQLAALVAEGDKQHKVCMSCHNVDPGGANKTGPLLYGVMGRTAGTHPGFAYSDAMKAYGKAWDYDGLYNFLKAPKGYIAGTSMSYAGMKKQEDRVALVAYLRSLSPAPAAIPAPDPTRDPAQAAAAAAAGAAAPASADAAPAMEGTAPAGNAVAAAEGAATNEVATTPAAATPPAAPAAPAPAAPAPAAAPQ